LFDVIIKNGTVIDGTGNPWFKADLGVKDERIVEIGRLNRAEAEIVLEAKDLVVCPGFIDMHSHSDLMWLANPRAEAKIMQGVTTELLGQDGISVAPVSKPNIEVIKGLWSGVMGRAEVEWDWSTIGEYLSRFERQGVAVNVATYVPHGNVRIEVMGMEDRSPTDSELKLMKELVEESMKDGAVGLSTGLIYVPCIYAKTDELIELCKVVAKYSGIFGVHMRNEGDQLIESVQEVISIGEKSGTPVQINHFKAAGEKNWGKVAEAFKIIEEARAKGVDITCDQYPYTAGSTTLTAILPPWVREGGVNKIIQRLKDPEQRLRIKKDIQTGVPGWDNQVAYGGWDGIIITSVASRKNKGLEGKTISEIAQLQKKSQADAAFDLLIEENTDVGMVIFCMTEQDVRTVMKHHIQMVGTDGLLGDGKPHPRAYGTYPRILGKYVREEKVLTLEEAIRKMTSFPAQRLGLKDRGLIMEEMYADVVVFNPKTIVDVATYENPIQYPIGVEYVLVNGEIVVDKGKHTGAVPGKVLRAYTKGS